MMQFLLLICALLYPGSAAQADLSAALEKYRRGDYEEAARLLESSCAGQDDCGEARIWLAKCQLKLRRWDDAIEELERAVRSNPEDSGTHLWLGRAYGRKAEHSFFLSAIGLARKVGREFETAVRLDPGNLDARFDLMEFCLQAPSMVGGGKSKAVAQAEAIAKVDTRLAHAARARVYEDEKKWQEAEQELSRAVQEFPDQPEVFADMAQFFFERQRYRESEAAVLQALALRPQYPQARMLRAALQVRMGSNPAEAEATLRGLSLGPLDDGDPAFDQVYYWLGMACLLQGKQAEARRAFDTALQFDPDNKDAKAALSRLR